jgi:hypothetical protein
MHSSLLKAMYNKWEQVWWVESEKLVTSREERAYSDLCTDLPSNLFGEFTHFLLLVCLCFSFQCIFSPEHLK